MYDPSSGLEQAKTALEHSHRPLIVSHVSLDGDAVGSELGLLYLLRALGKQPHVVNDGQVPQAYRFLTGVDELGTAPSQIGTGYDLVVALDIPHFGRMGGLAERLPSGLPGMNIDHHASNDRFMDVNWVEPERSSVGEMLFLLAQAAGWRLSADAATALYLAIVTDTDRFTLPNTTAESMRAASELVELGARHTDVGENLYRAMPLKLGHLMGMMLLSLKTAAGGEVATARLTSDMFRQTGTDAMDTQDFAEVPRSVKGTVTGVLLREMEGNRVKVSLRSRPGYNVEKVAGKFGGGGHVQAAGCVIEGTLDEVEEKVLEALEGVLRGKKG